MIRIAVAGLGFMGARHIRALRQVPGATLAAVISSNQAKLGGDLTNVGGNFGEPGEHVDFAAVRKFSDVQRAIDDPEIDALDICLPTDQHFPVALAALKAGKHVLVEKPLALTGHDADLLVEEARRLGRVLTTGHVLRYFPEYVALAHALRRGDLGWVRSAFFRRRCAAPAWSRWLSDPAKSGGAVMDLLIHDIDFCVHLFGKPFSVSAVGSSDPGIGVDWVEARLYYRDTGPVIVTGGWHHPKSYPFSMEWTVVSDAGTLDYRSGQGGVMLHHASGLAENLPLGDADPFVAEIADFVACAAAGTWPERCPPEESALAVRVARSVMQARERNGEVIECA